MIKNHRNSRDQQTIDPVKQPTVTGYNISRILGSKMPLNPRLKKVSSL
jgi:hypothetical protein